MQTPRLDEETLAAPKSPWVPLIAIPGLIVVVLVLIFLAFGGIGGAPPSIQENLRQVVDGGRNERTQAAFDLSQKMVANGQARLRGDPLPWPVPEDLEGEIAAVWDRTLPADVTTRAVLASLQAQIGAPDGVPHLLELMALGEDQDPGGKVRFGVLGTLGTSGDPRATPEVIAATGSDDPGLRSLAAILLQKAPAADARESLNGLLSDERLDVRANAAISLSKHGDPAGAEVLASLLDVEPYRAENALDSRRFGSAKGISQSRRRSAGALASLGRERDRPLFEVYRDDPDLEFRGVVLDILARVDGE